MLLGRFFFAGREENMTQIMKCCVAVCILSSSEWALFIFIVQQTTFCWFKNSEFSSFFFNKLHFMSNLNSERNKYSFTWGWGFCIFPPVGWYKNHRFITYTMHAHYSYYSPFHRVTNTINWREQRSGCGTKLLFLYVPANHKFSDGKVLCSFTNYHYCENKILLHST